jgi:flagellin
MTVISSNLNALRSSASLALAERAQSTAATRLSTGLRINSAKDDAAGLAITQKMTSYVRGITIALRNANDGLSFAQTAEAGLQQTTQMVQRMRELAVQSANGAMSSDNRIALQAEFDQLLSEVDNVARTTVFNGINMLKSDQATVLHTGSRAQEVTGLSIERSDTKSLGLRGFAPDGEIMSGRVGDPTGLQHNAILLNGKSWTTASAAASLSSTNAASRIASAINANVAEHNVIASAYNFVKGAAPTADTFAAGDLVINGDSVGAAANVGELVTNINRDVAGVMATLNPDGTISLTNNTGKQIEIGAGNAAKAGFVAGQTYQGFVNLKSLALEDIKITPANVANGLETNIGFVADLQKIGFNGSAGSQQLRGSAVTATAMDAADQLLINGIAIGAPAGATASQKAAAINAVADKTGVVSKSTTAVKVALDFTHRPKEPVKQVTTYAVSPGTDNDDKYEITINGQKIVIEKNNAGTDASSIKASILGVQLASGLTGVTGAQNRASALAAGLAAIINSDPATAPFVTAEAMSDGTLKLTALRAGEAFISDMKVSNTSNSVVTPPGSFGYTGSGAGNGGITGSFPNFTLFSADNGSAGTYVYSAAGAGIGMTFDFTYTTFDVDGASWDPAGYEINGVRTQLSNNSLTQGQSNSGTRTVNYPVGATFGWYITTNDGQAGKAQLVISNATIITAPPVVVAGTDDQMIFQGKTIQENVVDDSRSFRINGKIIDVTSARDVNELVSIINNESPAGVVAAADKAGNLILTSQSGENVTVENLSSQPGRFVKSVETLNGEKFAPLAEFKFGGTIETSDVAVVTINGVKRAVTASSTSANDVASRVADAINANASLNGSFIATAGSDGLVTLRGKSSMKGEMIALDVKFLEANPASPSTIGRGAGVDAVTYDGALPVDGQTVKVISNGVTSYGSLELTSTTGAQIRIDDLNGGATAAKFGLSAQGEPSDLVGGTLNILAQDASGLALRAIDLALEKLNLRTGELGAFQNTLEAKISLLTSGGADLEAARSRILDADYARETVQLSKTQILQQAATAMLAQANSQAQVVLSLLK